MWFPLCVSQFIKMINSLSKSDYFIKNNKMVNRNIEVVKLEFLKVKTWFWNKDLSSLDSIN